MDDRKTIRRLRDATLAAALLVAGFLATAALLPAQSSGTIRVQNMAPLARASWTTATVPLGTDHLQGDWTVRTDPACLAILGAKSSPRTRLLHLFVALDPFETRKLHFELASPPVVGDEPAPGADPVPPPPPAANPVLPALPQLRAVVGDTEGLCELVPIDVAEAAGRIVVHCRARVPGTMLVADAWFYHYPSSRVIPFELLLACSDPRTKAMRQDIDELELLTPADLVPVLRHAPAHGAAPGRLDAGTWRTRLLERTHFADAQGRAWSGALLLPKGANAVEAASLAAELRGPVYAMAQPELWASSGAWGPFGVLPTAHPEAERTFDAHIARAQRFASWAAVPRDPWEPAWLQVARPAQTGDQYDFGVTKLAPALATKGGGPAHIDEALFRAIGLARRLGHYREADGSPVLQAAHPDLVFWGQVVHWHPGVSPDRLGKDPWTQPADSHGWEGWDREHVSLNGLCGTYLLTGSHLLRELVRSSTESWLLGATTRDGWSTTSRGAPRSVGRTLLAMAWCYACTGDERIPQRMRERIAACYGDLLTSDADLLVLGVHGKDGRKLDGKHRFWMPWQEALGVVGLEAAYRVTGDKRFLAIEKRVLRSLTLWGWWRRGDGWTIGDAVAVLEDGKPLPPEAYGDPSLVKDHSGTDFDLWAAGAARLAVLHFADDPDSDVAQRARAIWGALRGSRAARSSDAFDRFGEWAAVLEGDR